MLDYTQLEALLAVDEAGTFEGAARTMNLSSFAVVQRIKALEAKLGVMLIERGPTRTSELGKVLCEHTREVKQLENEVIEQHKRDCLDASIGPPVLRIAINDEGFAPFFLDLMGTPSPERHAPSLDVQLVSQARASELMRAGNIVAALTCHSQTVFGFKTYELGDVTYRAVASPKFMENHFSSGVTEAALNVAPCLRYCGTDTLAQEWAEKVIGTAPQRLVSRPSSVATLAACLQGHFWSVQLDITVREELDNGNLVELIPNTGLQRSLYWHVTGALVDTVAPVTRGLKASLKRSD